MLIVAGRRTVARLGAHRSWWRCARGLPFGAHHNVVTNSLLHLWMHLPSVYTH